LRVALVSKHLADDLSESGLAVDCVGRVATEPERWKRENVGDPFVVRSCVCGT
jgi:hypothetical protein